MNCSKCKKNPKKTHVEATTLYCKGWMDSSVPATPSAGDALIQNGRMDVINGIVLYNNIANMPMYPCDTPKWLPVLLEFFY